MIDQFILWNNEPIFPFGPIADISLKVYQKYLFNYNQYNIPNWDNSREVFITVIKNNKLYPRYYVSNFARVYDIQSDRLLMFSFDKNQYSTCNLYDESDENLKEPKFIESY